MSANIVLSLSATKLEVAPGESVEATVTIRNQSQIVDEFDIRIQGLDPTWWTLSIPSVSLFPGDQGEAKLTIHPPKEAEARAGSYSFQVRAVSQANPEEMTEEEAYLILRGFLVWDVEMSPTKVVGGSGTYRLTASNLGNTDITLIFESRDPEEALNYTFSHDKVTVPAGESALITLKVHPKKGERGKLYSFQVLVRPAEAKVPSREAKTINGQLEYQRRRCPWKWILLILALLAAAFVIWKFIPPLLHPPLPVINSFTADRTSIIADDSLTLSWDVSGATAVIIDQGIGNVALTGTRAVSPTTTTTYTLTASNKAGSITATVQVTVAEVVYDFVAKAYHSSTGWMDGDGTLTFGATDDNRGFARYVTNAVLEDNRTYDKVLETYPQWVYDGLIAGWYNEIWEMGYKVEAGDRFYAKVGFLKDASAGNVKFLVWIIMDIEDGAFTPVVIAEITDAYDGILRTIDVDLSSYANKRAAFLLQVEANGPANQDWATWVEAEIIR